MPGNWKKKTFVQTIFQISTWKVLLLLLTNMFIMRNLTNFRKTVETGVDPCLQITNNKRNNRPNNEASRRTLLLGPFVSFGMRVPEERPNLRYHLSLISLTVGDSEITLRVVALLRTDPTAKQLTKFSN